MKKSIGVFLAVLMGIAVLAPAAVAQDEGRAAEVTQAELADILVNVLGLTRILPAAASPQEKFAALMSNGIVPADGWEPSAVVTKATLARLVVQAMGREDEVENPDDPNSWVDFLTENGIPIDTIGQAADSLDPLAQPVSDYVFRRSASSDPLVRQEVFGSPDERQFGTDVDIAFAVTPAEVREIIAAAAVVPVAVRPTTPDGGE